MTSSLTLLGYLKVTKKPLLFLSKKKKKSLQVVKMLWSGRYLPFEQRPTSSSAEQEAWTLIIQSLDFTLASNVALIIPKSHCGAIIMLLRSSVQIFPHGYRVEFSVFLKILNLPHRYFILQWSFGPPSQSWPPPFDPLVHINLTPGTCLLCKWFIIMPAFHAHYSQNVIYKMGRCVPRFHVNPLTWRLRLGLTLHISAS